MPAPIIPNRLPQTAYIPQNPLARPTPSPGPPRPTATTDQAILQTPVTRYSEMEIKQKLAPVFQKLILAGYGEIALTLKQAKYEVTNGKYLGREFHAAARGSQILLNGNSFWRFTPEAQASILLHEGVHLQQNRVTKILSNMVSLNGRIPKNNFAEKEAYLIQWGAMSKLKINERDSDNSEIFATVRFALEDMGVLSKSDG